MAIPRGFVRFRRDAVGMAVRERIKQALTIVPAPTSSFSNSNADVVIRLWAEEGDFIGVPRGFFNEKLRGSYVDDYEFFPSIGGNELQPTTPIQPREGQAGIIDKAVALIQSNPIGGAIIDATTGAGKTVLGLEVARRIGLKTLVIVHTSPLFDQWKEEIAKFFPNWKIGTLQADKIDVAGKDIVIGTLQSASLKDYPQSVYDEFGMMVIDEVHKAGAPEFGKVLTKFAPKHILGLSGTIQRADKAQNVFIYGIGRIISGVDQIKVMDPQVYFIDTGFVWFSRDNSAPLDRQKIDFLKGIVTCEARNEMIVRQAVKAVQADRNVLILTERVVHAEELYARVKKATDVSVGIMVGTTKKADRKVAQEAKILCATNQLIGVGFNIPRLDTLIFATPVQEVIQPVGRIRRELEGKKPPFVLDLVDSNAEVALRLGMSRRKKYLAKGWKLFGTAAFKPYEDELARRKGYR